MPILIYRQDFSDSPFLNEISNRALSQDATVNLAGGFLSKLVAFDITSTDPDDTDGTNLDPFMARLGFTRISVAGAKILDTVAHWGSFEVADAPAANVSNGDLGFCVDGNLGFPSTVEYDGIVASQWVNSHSKAPLSVAGVATASVFSGGTYTGTDGNYSATQQSTTGLGQGAEFTVTLTAGAITAVVSVDTPGSRYNPFDSITINVLGGPTETVPAVLTVDSIS